MQQRSSLTRLDAPARPRIQAHQPALLATFPLALALAPPQVAVDGLDLTMYSGQVRPCLGP